MCQVIYSLLLLPLHVIRPLLPHLLSLLEHVNELNCFLPDTGVLEEQELEGTLFGKKTQLASDTSRDIIIYLLKYTGFK